MELIRDWGRQNEVLRPKTVFTIGVFDGLHLGHKILIEAVLKEARRLKAQSLVLTFDPHPLAVLAPAAAPPLLSTVEQKAEILSQWGLDRLGVLHFSKEMALLEPQKFLYQYLGRYIDPAAAVLGPDFAFGKNARGNASVMEDWLAESNSKARLHIISAQAGPDGLYSSSQIRQDLKNGLVESAARDLGRFYRLEGTVVHGQARGRTLGFPTANLGQIKQLVPAAGVYAVKVRLEGEAFDGMTSIGYNPTFGEQPMTVETNIFDFDRFIYSRQMSIDFIAHLRDMVRFKSAEQLASQLSNDRLAALKVLKGNPEE